MDTGHIGVYLGIGGEDDTAPGSACFWDCAIPRSRICPGLTTCFPDRAVTGCNRHPIPQDEPLGLLEQGVRVLTTVLLQVDSQLEICERRGVPERAILYFAPRSTCLCPDGLHHDQMVEANRQVS